MKKIIMSLVVALALVGCEVEDNVTTDLGYTTLSIRIECVSQEQINDYNLSILISDSDSVNQKQMSYTDSVPFSEKSNVWYQYEEYTFLLEPDSNYELFIIGSGVQNSITKVQINYGLVEDTYFFDGNEFSIEDNFYIENK